MRNPFESPTHGFRRHRLRCLQYRIGCSSDAPCRRLGGRAKRIPACRRKARICQVVAGEVGIARGGRGVGVGRGVSSTRSAIQGVIAAAAKCITGRAAVAHHGGLSSQGLATTVAAGKVAEGGITAGVAASGGFAEGWARVFGADYARKVVRGLRSGFAAEEEGKQEYQERADTHRDDTATQQHHGPLLQNRIVEVLGF